MVADLFIDPTSLVSSEARIGHGTKIWQFCTVLPGADIGEGCVLSQNVYVEGKTRIGNRVKIKNNVSVYECVEINDDVFIGPSVVFTNVLLPRSFVSRKNEFKKTRVLHGATIGANSTIICGVTIGEYAMVGAGSVVTSDVPPFALFYGVPARQQGWVCACGEHIATATENQDYRCQRCGSNYRIGEGWCEPVMLCVH
ncbi:MAG: acyltransferase [Methanoregula sp.]|nr:acyltransferase [Methanoregula sp.]